jgi:hypothetical protein
MVHGVEAHLTGFASASAWLVYSWECLTFRVTCGDTCGLISRASLASDRYI